MWRRRRVHPGLVCRSAERSVPAGAAAGLRWNPWRHCGVWSLGELPVDGDVPESQDWLVEEKVTVNRELSTSGCRAEPRFLHTCPPSPHRGVPGRHSPPSHTPAQPSDYQAGPAAPVLGGPWSRDLSPATRRMCPRGLRLPGGQARGPVGLGGWVGSAPSSCNGPA